MRQSGPEAWRFVWRIFLSEWIGTAVLVLVGLSLVIVMFGVGSPTAAMLPDAGLRRLLTGFLFGIGGGLIALSAWSVRPVERTSTR